MKKMLVVLALAAGIVATVARAQPPLRFAEAELFLELNDTDGDLGIHGSIDGLTWTNLTVEGPDDRLLLSIVSSGRLRTQGLTQLAMESA